MQTSYRTGEWLIDLVIEVRVLLTMGTLKNFLELTKNYLQIKLNLHVIEVSTEVSI